MTNTKVCFKCEKNLPVEEFYKHPQMADGRLGKCKTCAKADSIATRNEKIEYYRNYDRARSENPARIANDRLRNMSASRAAQRRAYQQTDHGREITRKIKRAWAERNPRKRAAQILFRNRQRYDKSLAPQPCIRCGAKAHGHHENYDKPLEVIWLCPQHHKDRHKEMKKLGIEP